MFDLSSFQHHLKYQTTICTTRTLQMLHSNRMTSGKRDLTSSSSSTAAVVVQVVAIVIATLFLGVRQHGEGLAHLLELLLLLLLHLRRGSAVAVCPGNATRGERYSTVTNDMPHSLTLTPAP